MTRTIASNRDNDLVIDATGNLKLLTGLSAVAADCRSAMQAQRGEMVLAQDRGLPTLATVWSKYTPAAFEAAARRALLRVPDVLAVESLTVQRDGPVVRYTAAIRTTYGSAVIDAV